MRARIVILPDGQISVFVEEGGFDAAVPELEKFFNGLGAAGFSVDALSQPEQHRHDHEHEYQKEVNHGQ